MVAEIVRAILWPELPPNVVMGWLQFLPAIGAGVSALSGLFGARSAANAGRQAEGLQRQGISAAQRYSDMAMQDFERRAPLRERAEQGLMNFRGSPANPFSAGMFGGLGTPPANSGGSPLQAIARLLGGIGGGGVMPTPGPAIQAGMPGAFNPTPPTDMMDRFSPINPQASLVGQRINPQVDRRALDLLLSRLGVGG